MWLALFLIFIAAINSTIGNIFLKMSRDSSPLFNTFLGKYLSIYFILAIVFYVFNLLCFSKAIDKIPVAIAYPILAGLGFSMLSIAAHYLFDEHLSLLQILGLVFVLIGIILLAK